MDEPCANLAAGGRCTIHERLADAGFGGCVAYDCHGAGQLVVQEMFGGQSWQDKPHLRAPMTRAFRAMCRIRERQILLAEAAKLPLTEADRQRLEALRAALAPQETWTAQSVEALETSTALGETDRFLRSLDRYLVKTQAGPGT